METIKILKTTTGTQWNLSKPARSNAITHIADDGSGTMSTLTILGIAGTHVEFMEVKTDLKVIDQFGDVHCICEDNIWQ